MTEDSRTAASSLERRVASLEEAVRELSKELEHLRGRSGVTQVARAEIGDPGAHASGAPTRQPQPLSSASTLRPELAPRTPAAPGSQGRVQTSVDLESLVGRYGTLVLATITALAAVGTFLGWAISQGWLGPSQRLALGLLAAIALAVAGLRLRRTERSFGASLLGLALAITLVCAWGAGPSLGIVPTWVAFLLAAIASIALAVFAHSEDDEPLWSVGFSGAALAPFVTSGGKANLLLLFAYGIAVLAAAGYAMGGRPWMVAGRLFLTAAGAYTAALALGMERDAGPLLAMALPLGAALAGVLPWTTGFARRERLRALGALAGLAAIRAGLSLQLPVSRATSSALVAGAGVLWLGLVASTHRVASAEPPSRRPLHEGDWLDAAVLPLAFVLGAIIALDAGRRTSGIAVAVAAGVLFASMIRWPRGSLRDAAVFATMLCALVAAILLLPDRPLAFTGAVIGLGLLCFISNLAWPSISWTTLGLIGFVWAFAACLVQLTERPSYAYTPFLTRESLASLALLAAVMLAWRCVTADDRLSRLLRSGAIVWAFAWIHQEIAFAVNHTVATLLLVTYYAATSVLAVAVGRARGVAVLRRAGLALAILAAGTALYGASQLDAVLARIVADLVAAVFLLAVAYWYRRPGGLRSEP